MALAQGLSRWPRADCVVWLLLITLMQISTENEQAQQRQNVRFEEKRSTRKRNGAKLSNQNFKESADSDGREGVVTSGQGPT